MKIRVVGSKPFFYLTTFSRTLGGPQSTQMKLGRCFQTLFGQRCPSMANRESLVHFVAVQDAQQFEAKYNSHAGN